MGLLPLVAMFGLDRHMDGRPIDPPDAGIYRGLVANPRDHGSLTTPADQFWLRLSPAQVAERDGFVPVADFAPLYPAVVAISGSDVDTSFVRIHALALGVGLLALGAIVTRATGSVLAGVGGQAFVLIGPTFTGVLDNTVSTADIYALVGADGLATSLLLLALWVWPRVREAPNRCYVAASALLTAACLTRYGLLGAAAGLLAAGGLDLLRSRQDRERRRHAIRTVAAGGAAVAATVLWSWLYERATQGPPSKQLTLHLRDLSPAGATMGGWLGLDLTSTTQGYLAMAVVTAVGLAGFASRDRLRSAAGAMLVTYLALDLATPLVLDYGVAFDAERALLPVRLLLAIIVVSFASDLPLARLAAAAGPVRARVRPAMASLSVAAVLVVALGGPTFVHDRPPPSTLPRDLGWPGGPVLSNAPDALYRAIDRPVIDLPRPEEYSTRERLDVPEQAAALVRELLAQGHDRVRIVFLIDLQGAPLAPDDWPPCVVLSPLVEHPSYQTQVLDLRGCRD